MSLFERDQVMPPVPCSRCGRDVAASSLFCPACGQSMLRPLPTPEPAQADEANEQAPDSPGEGEPATVSQTKDTFSRAADWLRRLGKIKDEPESNPSEEHPRQAPTIGETVQQARAEAKKTPLTGDETMALPIFDSSFLPEAAEGGRPSSRRQRRFVLKVAGGKQHTIGDIPGGMGSAADHPSPDGGPWQWVQLSGEESIDPVHLYFGHENGVLWVADQGSAFGTIVIEPEQAPMSCEPHQKYFLIRGSEIRVGGVSITIH